MPRKSSPAKLARLPKFKRGQALMISWHDICTRDDWADQVESKPPVCNTLGWFLQQDDVTITLASTVSGDVGWFAQVVIPKGCIIEWHRMGFANG